MRQAAASIQQPSTPKNGRTRPSSAGVKVSSKTGTAAPDATTTSSASSPKASSPKASTPKGAVSSSAAAKRPASARSQRPGSAQTRSHGGGVAAGGGARAAKALATPGSGKAQAEEPRSNRRPSASVAFESEGGISTTEEAGEERRRMARKGDQSMLRAAGDLAGGEAHDRAPSRRTTKDPDMFAQEPEVMTTRVSVLRRNTTVDVTGNHNLGVDDLELVMNLHEAAGCRLLRLNTILEGNLQIVLMFPEGVHKSSARRPTVLLLGSSSRIHRELGAFEATAQVFNEHLPSILDSSFLGNKGVMQLEFVGSRCCLPAHVSSFHMLTTFGKLFQSAMQEEADKEIQKRALKTIYQVFGVVLQHSTLKRSSLEVASLVDIFGKAASLTSANTAFGADYYDGRGGIPPEVQEQYGSVISDGRYANEMERLVKEVTGKLLLPSEFVKQFQIAMTDSLDFWKLSVLKGHASNHFAFDKILLDDEGFPWVLGIGIKHGAHVFTDLAMCLVSALFVHSKIETQKDKRHIEEVVFLVASVTELNHWFPEPPYDASSHVRFLWTFVGQMIGLFTIFSTNPETGKKLDKPNFQMLWALFDCAIEMVPSRLTKSSPEHKRLALFGALAFATHILVHMECMPEPEWLKKRQGLWGAYPSTHSRQPWMAVRPHLLLAGTTEAWVYDYITRRKHSVLDTSIQLVIPKQSVFRRQVSRDVEATAPVDGFILEGLVALENYWAKNQRVVLIGGPGAGKTLTTKALITHIVQEQVEAARGHSSRQADSTGRRPREEAVVFETRDEVEDDDDCEGTYALSPSRGTIHGKPVFANEPKSRLLAFNGAEWVIGDLDCLSALRAEGTEFTGFHANAGARLTDIWQNFSVTIKVADITEKIPLRVPLARLAHLCDQQVSDPLQEYTAEVCNKDRAIAALTWRPSDERPHWPARYGHQIVNMDGTLLMFGGCGKNKTPLRDVWALPCGSARWEELPVPPWCARYGHQVIIHERKLLLTGGIGVELRPLMDAWESDDGGQSWNQLPVPRWGGRHRHKMCKFSISRGPGEVVRPHILLIGGLGQGDKVYGDVWASDNGGYSWAELERPPWSARQGHMVVTIGDKLLLCGGIDKDKRRLDDVWILTGRMWRLQNPGQRPLSGGGRQDSGVRQDAPSHGREEVKAQWEEMPNVPWPARDGHQAMEFRGKLVVFGGCGDNNETLCDAWASADLGRTWRQLPRAAWLPVASRSGHGVTRWDDVECVGNSYCAVLGGAGVDGQPLCDLLKQQPLHLILDGLDEVETSMLDHVTNYIGCLLSCEPRHCVLITTRPSGVDACADALDSWGCKRLHTKQFDDEDLRYLCAPRLPDLVADAQQANAIGQSLLRSEHRELVRTPLMALLMLHAMLNNKRKKELGWLEVYAKAFEYSLQGLDEAKRFDTSEFRKNQEQGLDAGACELAFEMQSRGLRWMTPRAVARYGLSDTVDCLIKLAIKGSLPLLFEVRPDELQIRHTTMQEYLAAKHLSQCLSRGGELPQWFLNEKSGNEGALGCGRFFCALLAENPVEPKRFDQLCDSFGCLLRNMARVGDQNAIRYLVVKATNRQNLLEAADPLGTNRTALHVAARRGCFEAARVLLGMAPDPASLNAKLDASGYTALHYAAKQGCAESSRILLQFARDVWVLLTIAETSDRKLMPLHLAAAHGHDGVVRTLLDISPSSAALNAAADSAGCTALHHAAQHGHDKVTHSLLETTPYRHIMLTAKNKYDRRTPLHLAADSGHDVVVRTMLRFADNRSDSSQLYAARDLFGQSALHLAADKGHAATVTALLDCTHEAGAILAARESMTGRTPLHIAADSGHAETVRAILDGAPDKQEIVAAVDRCGRYTPLHIAVERGRTDVARALLELAPDPQRLLLMSESFSGQRPLHLAACSGQEDMVNVLMELAPDPLVLLDIPDRAGGFTPLQLACEKGHKTVANVLLKFAPAADRSKLLLAKLEKWCGFTSMHLAALKGHEATCSVLLQYAPDRRAPLNCKDRVGRTPAQLAADKGHAAVAALLA